VLQGALRRIAAIVAVLVGGTAAISAALGALAGRSILHSLATGYYLVGAAVLLGCFVIGVRGPLRRDSGDDGEVPAIPPSLFSSQRLPSRRRKTRRATLEERRESRLTSLGLFALALLLIVIGSIVDPTHRAF